jgi:hypothetical protein
MDKDTIKNLIRSLGKNDFDKVIYLIITKVLDISCVNVDGQHDGGADFLNFDSSGFKNTINQVTIQKSRWEKKAFDDAKKAKEKYSTTRYYFFTSIPRSSITLRRLETKISTELNMTAMCLSGTEISSMIYDSSLTSEFLDKIGAPLVSGIAKRPDKQEIFIHAYSNYSNDKIMHQEQVLDDAILFVLFENKNLIREELINGAITLLDISQDKNAKCNSRIDSLLSRSKIKKDKLNNNLFLNNTVQE